MGISLPHRKVVVVEDEAYKAFEELASKYGVKINELMSYYLNFFDDLKQLLDEEVSFLREKIKDVSQEELMHFSLLQIFRVFRNMYKIFKGLVRNLGLLEKGFTILFIDPILDEHKNLKGLYIHFDSSKFSKSPIEYVNLQIGGIYTEVNDQKIYYDRGGLLEIYSYVASKEELGERYELIRDKLRDVLKKRHIEDALTEIESYICDLCDTCDVKAGIEELNGDLKLRIEAFAEDFTCLPPIEKFEKVIRSILRKVKVYDNQTKNEKD